MRARAAGGTVHLGRGCSSEVKSVSMHLPPAWWLLATLLSLGCVKPSAEAAETSVQSSAATATPHQRGQDRPFAGRALYVDPKSEARAQAELWRRMRLPGVEAMEKLAEVPLALWVGDWVPDPEREVDRALTEADDRLRTLVVYNIPQRDCGSHSAGGAGSARAYERFVAGVAAGIRGRRVILILEPDALAHDECLDEIGRAERWRLLGSAVDTLSAAGASVYIDAGDSNWIAAEDMARRLRSAGVDRAAGFALNVAHTELTEHEMRYAGVLRAILGPDAHYVIDTGRNGVGPSPDNAWCNPRGRKNGQRPTLDPATTGLPGDARGLDALLWIKKPGYSDGRCNGGPAAGKWWPEYALELAE